MTVEFNSDSHYLSDSTSNNANTLRHGLMPKLSGSSLESLTGEGKFYNLGQYAPWYVYNVYTTGASTDTELVATSSTYKSAVASATTFMYPLFSVSVPQYVEMSKVALTIVHTACSTHAGTTNEVSGLYLYSGRHKLTPTASTVGGIELGAASDPYRIPGVLKFFASADTSVAQTVSTELLVSGGEWFTLFACATNVPLAAVHEFKITGLESTLITLMGGWSWYCNTTQSMIISTNQ